MIRRLLLAAAVPAAAVAAVWWEQWLASRALDALSQEDAETVAAQGKSGPRCGRITVDGESRRDWNPNGSLATRSGTSGRGDR